MYFIWFFYLKLFTNCLRWCLIDIHIYQVTWFSVPEKNRVSWKPCIMRLVKIHINCSKFSRYADFTRIFSKNPCKSAKIGVSNMFLEPIQNCISARSAHIKAAYLKALLYMFFCFHCTCCICRIDKIKMQKHNLHIKLLNIF